MRRATVLTSLLLVTSVACSDPPTLAGTVTNVWGQKIEGATIRLEGPSPYDLTAELLAWGAAMAATRPVTPGAHGPVDAFGLDALERGCADMGLVAIT